MRCFVPATDKPAADAKDSKETKETGKLSKRQRIKAIEAEKKRQKEEQFQQRLRTLRCPLCVAENVTVPADQVVFTANGTRAVFGDDFEGGGDYVEHSAPNKGKSVNPKVVAVKAPVPVTTTSAVNKKIKFGDDGTAADSASAVSSAPSTSAGGPKAAPTVCKWGGGYSSREEKGKSAKKRKLNVTTDEEGGIVKIAKACKFGPQCKRQNCWFQH